GGSTVFGPDGNRHVQGPFYEPALVQTTLDTADLRPARISLPLLRDERIPLTAQTLERIQNKPL
ncbi:MAG: carbon-nitrogen hydrolase, partial [Chloroflexota bacterium]